MGVARFNMGNSLMVGAVKVGMNFTACAPKEYFPNPDLIKKCEEIAAQTGAKLTFEEDPEKACKNADFIYTDVWVSMGEPDDVWETRIKQLGPYQVTKKLMDLGNKDCKFMHCLPAYHDLKTKVGKGKCQKFNRTEMEVTDEVFESDKRIT